MGFHWTITWGGCVGSCIRMAMGHAAACMQLTAEACRPGLSVLACLLACLLACWVRRRGAQRDHHRLRALAARQPARQCAAQRRRRGAKCFEVLSRIHPSARKRARARPSRRASMGCSANMWMWRDPRMWRSCPVGVSLRSHHAATSTCGTVTGRKRLQAGAWTGALFRLSSRAPRVRGALLATCRRVNVVFIAAGVSLCLLGPLSLDLLLAAKGKERALTCSRWRRPGMEATLDDIRRLDAEVRPCPNVGQSNRYDTWHGTIQPGSVVECVFFFLSSFCLCPV